MNVPLTHTFISHAKKVLSYWSLESPEPISTAFDVIWNNWVLRLNASASLSKD